MPHPVAIAGRRVLPGIRPTVLGTLSIELVVDVWGGLDGVRARWTAAALLCVGPSESGTSISLRAAIGMRLSIWGLPWCTDVHYLGGGGVRYARAATGMRVWNDLSHLHNVSTSGFLCNLRHRGGETLRNPLRNVLNPLRNVRNLFSSGVIPLRNLCETLRNPCESLV